MFSAKGFADRDRAECDRIWSVQFRTGTFYSASCRIAIAGGNYLIRELRPKEGSCLGTSILVLAISFVLHDALAVVTVRLEVVKATVTQAIAHGRRNGSLNSRSQCRLSHSSALRTFHARLSTFFERFQPTTILRFEVGHL